MKKIYALILILCIAGATVAPSVILADTGSNTSTGNPADNPLATYTLLEPLPCLNDGTQDCAKNTMIEKVNFADYVRYIFNLIIALSAVAAVLVIVAGGFKYVTTDSFLGKNEGKKMIFQALQGLLLVLCSYLILRTIDPRLVDIPSTIVKPLDIKYEKGETWSFLTQVSSAASKNKVKANNAIVAARKADENLSGKNERIKELEEMIAKDPNSVASQRMREEISQIKLEDSYKSQLAEKELQSARANFLNQVSSAQSKVASNLGMYSSYGGTLVKNSEAALVNGTQIDAEFDGTINSIEQSRLNRISHPDVANNQQAINAINQEAYYAKGILLLSKVESRLARMKIDLEDTTYDGTPAVYFSSMGRKSMRDAYTEIQDDLSTTMISAVITKMPDEKMRNELLTKIPVLQKQAGSKFGKLFEAN